jgi:ATP-dependent RNA helicase RhlE
MNSTENTTFAQFNLPSQILKNIETEGYTAPTPIQSDAIPLVMEGKDLIGLAQTGTGKTAAFVLPILNKLLSGKKTDKPTVLIITPTRELAEQVGNVVRSFSKGTWIRSMCIYGGMSMARQISELRRPQHVIIGCPGRLLDHLERRTLSLQNIDTLVLDEADQLHDMGFLPSIRSLLRQIPAKRQTLLFSATMEPEIERLIGDTQRNPVKVQTATLAPATTVKQLVLPVKSEKKKDLLVKLLREISGEESVLIFTRTKHRAKSLDEQLQRSGFAATSLQGNLSQAKRAVAMKGFRSGKYQIMVATDIAARGIDVSLVSHVINFDLPDTHEAYTHRIGRTGRASRQGTSYTLVTPEERGGLRAIEHRLKRTIERKTYDGFSFELGEFKAPRPSAGPRRDSRGRAPARGRSAAAR